MDWAEVDWIGYDNFIAECISMFIVKKGVIPEPALSDGGWQKQFRQQHGDSTFEFIADNIEGWLKAECVRIEEFNAQYASFCDEDGTPLKFRKGAKKMNEALAAYCHKENIEFNGRYLKRDGYDTFRTKRFVKEEVETTADEKPFDLF